MIWSRATIPMDQAHAPIRPRSTPLRPPRGGLSSIPTNSMAELDNDIRVKKYPVSETSAYLVAFVGPIPLENKVGFNLRESGASWLNGSLPPR